MIPMGAAEPIVGTITGVHHRLQLIRDLGVGALTPWGGAVMQDPGNCTQSKVHGARDYAHECSRADGEQSWRS